MSSFEDKRGDPEAIRRELAAMRREVEQSGGIPRNVEAMLRRLAEMRNSIPGIDEVAPKKRAGGDGRAPFAESVEEFDALTLMEALEAFVDDVSAYVDHRRQALVDRLLQIYYDMEELSHDPAHADLLPQLETMRRAYERDYGHPIPPRPKDR